MPIESIIVSALVVAAFAAFALALAYAEYQTRHFKREADRIADVAESHWREAA